MTAGDRLGGVGINQVHIRAQTREEGHVEFFADSSLLWQIDVCHISDRPAGHPVKTLRAVA
jgi:hypothetical protein